jgi:hypothetical protein
MHFQGEVYEIPSGILIATSKKRSVWQLRLQVAITPLITIDGVVEVMCRALEVIKEFSSACATLLTHPLAIAQIFSTYVGHEACVCSHGYEFSFCIWVVYLRQGLASFGDATR